MSNRFDNVSYQKTVKDVKISYTHGSGASSSEVSAKSIGAQTVFKPKRGLGICVRSLLASISKSRALSMREYAS